MIEKRLKIWISFGVGLGLIAALAFVWSKTPSFGLAQIYWAVSFQDEALFRSRLDVGKVAKGFASDFVESQLPKMAQGGIGGDVLTQILIPFREQFEAKTTEAVEEFVTDYFNADSHGYMKLIRWLPVAAVKSVIKKDPEFHLTSWPRLTADEKLAMLKLELVWWEERKDLIAKIEKQADRWVVTRVIVTSVVR